MEMEDAAPEILILDGDRARNETTMRLLCEQGYVVAQAFDGQAALAAIERQAPDLILWSVDDLATCRQVRERLDAARTVIVALCPPDRAPDERFKELLSGINAHIQRPIGEEELLARIASFVRSRRARQRHGFYVQLLDSVHESVVVTDLDGRVIYWGPGAEALYGYSSQEVMGRSITFVVDDEDREKEQARIAQVLERGEWRGQYRQQRKDGSIFWADTVISLIRDETGAPMGLIGIDRDMTAEREAREVLRRQQARLEAMLQARADEIEIAKQQWEATADALPQIVCLLDIEGNVVRANRAVEAWGLGRVREVRGRSLHDLLHPGCAGVDCGWQEQWSLPLSQLGRGMSWDDELWDPRLQKHLYAQLRPVSTISTGTVALVIQDITESQRARRALQESERRYRLLAEHATDMISRHGPAGRYRYASPACETLVGYQPEELVGRSAYDLFHPDDAAAIRRSHHAIVEASTSSVVEYRIHHKQGHYVWVETTSQAVRDPESGQVIEIIAVTRDVTERRQMQRALRESEELHRVTLESIPNPVFVTDDEGRFTFVCPNVPHTLGYTAPEIEAMGGIEALIGDQGLDLCRLETEGALTGVECALTDKEGRERVFLVDVRRVSIGRGTTLYVFNEFTAQKQLREELRERDATARALLNATTESAALFERDGTLVALNQAVARIFGQPAAALIGQSAYDLLPPEVARPRRAWVEQVIRTRQPVRFEDVRQGRHIDNSVYPVLDDEGQVARLAVFAQDITARVQAERALRESERRFRTMADTAPVLIWMAGPDKGCTFFNQPWLDFTGRTLEQELGDGWAEGVHPDDLAACVQTYETAFDVRRNFRMEYRLRRADGQYRWILDIGAPRFADDGAFAGYIGSCIDISERREAEERLRESEHRFRALFSLAPDATFLVDAETGLIADANPAAETLLQRPRAEIVGLAYTDLYPPEQRSLIREAFHDPAFGERVSSSRAFDILRKDGEQRNVEIRARRIRLGSQAYVLGVFRDVTEYEQMQRALQASEARFRAIVESSTDHIFMLDPQGVYLASNKRFDHFGLPAGGSLVGRHLRDVYPPPVAKLYVGKLTEVIDSGRAVTFEHPLPGPEGELYHVDTLYPIVRDGDVQAVGGTCRDVTLSKQAEAALQQYADHLRGLAARLAEVKEAERQQLARELHDQVGQNLTALGINLNIIRAQLTDSGALAAVQKRLEDSLALVEQTTGRVRDVMVELRPPVLDDYGLLAALKWYAEQAADRANIPIRVTGQEIVPRPSQAVETALFRVAQEAVTNAIKHAQTGQIRLELHAEAEGIRLTIADDGVGFDPLPPRLSHPPGERHGWGLMTMAERAEAVGGRCQVESEPGQGTRVVVEAPA